MKHLKMSLNIVIAASLLTAVACSSSSSNPGSTTEPELTGYWKGECIIDNGRSGYSDYAILHFADDGTLTKTTYKFDGTTCSGEPISANGPTNGTFTLGTVVTESPLTQEFMSFLSCTEFYSTFKIQNNTLYVANAGGDGSTAETRATDFTDADELTPITEADIPALPEPVSVEPQLCLK